MRKNIILSMLLASLALVSCAPSNGGSSNSNTPSTSENEKSYQLIKDNTFQQGFLVNPANGFRQDDGWTPDNRWPMDVELEYGDQGNGSISWIVSQHGDVYSLNDKYNEYTGIEPEYEDGYYTYYDESKQMSINPDTGHLYLELNASKEYARPRKQFEAWPHLLLNQGFDRAIRVQDVESVDFTIDIELKKFEDHMDGQADSSLHAVQFLMYIVVKSEQAADASSFFWFGIPFFDNRMPNGTDESGLIDAGSAGATSKFIYGMPSYDYLPNGLPLNEKQSVNVDIKPYLGRALIMARELGHFTNSTIDDLTFQSMNIGFEIPGTYDCGIEISNFSLTANFK